MAANGCMVSILHTIIRYQTYTPIIVLKPLLGSPAWSTLSKGWVKDRNKGGHSLEQAIPKISCNCLIVVIAVFNSYWVNGTSSAFRQVVRRVPS